MRTIETLVICAALLAASGPLAAQSASRSAAPPAVDSVTVVAGERYRAGELQEFLLGSKYRDVWATPVRVEVLDLERFAGGLTPVRRGGSVQTRALRLRGADGREYNFRSVDKELTPALPEYAQETVLDWLRQDQTSAQHPAAVLVATALLDEVGVLNPGPRLVVMPDHPRLGEFREEFAGVLGTIEVHADEGEEGQRLFAGFPEVESTEDMLEEVEESPEDRIDARAFLKARMMDVFLGDWDRHEGQWRWARRDSAGVRWWIPVPEDRDYAFVDHDGLLLWIARRAVTPRVIHFDGDYADLLAMMANSEEFTRRLLAELPRPVWDSVAAELQAALTYRAIDRAVATLPPEYRAQGGDELARILRARRDRIPEMARKLYRVVAHTPLIHATDERDRLVVERAPDGSVEVRLYPLEGGDPEPYFRRWFLPGETREIRIHLHGGDDVAVVRGDAARSIPVRIVGGGGDDVLEDRSRGRTAFYDARGENRFVTGPRTSVDRRPYERPDREGGLLPSSVPDWGASQSVFAPWADWVPFAGLVVGGGPTWTRYGFRHDPYVHRSHLRALWAPGETRFGLEYEGDFRRENSPRHVEVTARATELEAVRFHGFGNEVEELPEEQSLVWLRRFSLEPLWHFPLSPRVDFAVGPVLRYTDPDEGPESTFRTLRPLGSGSFGQAGAQAEAELDTRDDRLLPRRGFRAEVEGSAYPPLWDAAEGFGRVRGVAATYLSLPGAAPVLALRAGGERVLGEFPVYEAAFLGGSGNLRGFPHGRFAGDALLHGSAELRVPLAETKLVLRGTLGALAFTDAGRVYFEGDSPGGWHTAVGGGLWFATPLGTVVASYARGEEENRVYLRLGMPF